jgi:hypothetical protein
MIKNYRILVDGQYYTGEKEVEFNTWSVDPWSKSSFQTKHQARNVLTFEPKANNNFKTVVGTINLIGEVKRIIEFCNYTELMAGNKIVIEAEPYEEVEFYTPRILASDAFQSLEAMTQERNEWKARAERTERMVERLIIEGNLMAEKLAISRWEDDQPLDWKDLVAEWQARNE